MHRVKSGPRDLRLHPPAALSRVARQRQREMAPQQQTQRSSRLICGSRSNSNHRGPVQHGPLTRSPRFRWRRPTTRPRTAQSVAAHQRPVATRSQRRQRLPRVQPSKRKRTRPHHEQPASHDALLDLRRRRHDDRDMAGVNGLAPAKPQPRRWPQRLWRARSRPDRPLSSRHARTAGPSFPAVEVQDPGPRPASSRLSAIPSASDRSASAPAGARRPHPRFGSSLRPALIAASGSAPLAPVDALE